jgi:hypothetical protein
VVQELLRHGSVRITMDLYAQAKMQDTTNAQLKMIEEFRTQVMKRRSTGTNWSPNNPRANSQVFAKLFRMFDVPDGIRTCVTTVKVTE